MCRKSVCLIVFVLGIMSLSARAELVHHWRLDEDTAAGDTVVVDSAGGLNGTIEGARSVPGKAGNALSFDGSDDVVTVLYFVPPQQGTVVFWINPALASSKQRILGAGGDYEVWLRGNGELKNELFDGGSTTTGTGPGALNANQWNHVAATYDSTTTAVEIYLDGELKVAGTANVPSTPTETTLLFGHRTGAGGGEHYGGLLDDVQIYDAVLNAEQIKWLCDNPGKVATPPVKAKEPYPADGAIDVPREVVLGWTPGIFAPPTNGHKVYLSNNFNDVNDGVGGVTQDANSYAPPQCLDFGTTYYWRIDEVNGPPDFTVYPGDVWSFTTEPVGYAIENITATASSAHAADMGPEKTIDGSGLDDNDLHSIEPTDMWLSSNESLGAWIEYEFDKVYKLHEMWVWNSNQMIEPLVGFGLRDVTIEYSTNGTDYTTLGTAHEFAQAPGAAGYAHNTTVDFGGVAAKYVKLTANSNWGALPQYGLSEVRFFCVPVRAREPSPDSGATDVAVDVTIGFRAGREAAQHNVYLSPDEQAVIDGTAPVTTVSQARHGPLSLDLGTTYYWRVNEVNEAQTPATWQGTVWDFTTQEYFVVDDFESYNDLEPDDPESNRIFNVWVDGYEVPTNGSLVGYENPPFCERTIVHGGRQSMPFFYDNSGTANYSEASLTLSSPQDWTKQDVKVLVLWFRGEPANAAAPMYVALNGSAVVYHDNPDVAVIDAWTEWNIELQGFADQGVNLANVNMVSIGFGDKAKPPAGGSGKMYFDDIRLRK